MEIGYPTDVKHVAHIGWDGPSGNAPTWVRVFSQLFCTFLCSILFTQTINRVVDRFLYANSDE